MPIPVPSSRPARRRQRPKPQGVRPENDNIHSPVDAQNLDELVSLSISQETPLDVMAELLTVGSLLSFAVQAASPIAGPLLTSGSFTAGTLIGDSSYVAGAQAGAGSNPARSDLDGLAPNTYQLKIDIGQAFQIKGIGGRAYRPYRSDHTTGHAIDIPGSGERGQAIAEWVVQRAAIYKVKYIIFNYRIWYPGKGWAQYNPSSAVKGFASDAGHVRHVHVSTY